jgi:8-oxo-dGTP pyrophosphatase MutT (NUDIX family)
MRQAGMNTKGLLRASVGQQLGYLIPNLLKVAPLALGAYGIHKYVNTPEKGAPEPKMAQEKTAIRAVDRTVNTMARPRDDKSVITATIMGTEHSMQRTPALPDPDAPEDGDVHLAALGMSANDFFDALEKASAFKSDSQRRWMYANKPEMAEEWEEETPKGKDLPEKVGRAAGALLTGVGLLSPELKKKIEDEAEEWDVQKALHNLGLTKGAAKKPYRNRVDVIALDKKDRLYSGLYPDGSIGLFGGGLDKGETSVAAAAREFKEEAGRGLLNARRLAIPNYEESRLARKGWKNAGKGDRLKRYGGTRSFTVVGDVAPGKKQGLLEPADHIRKVKFRPLTDAIGIQEKAVQNSTSGHKGVLRHRLKALKAVQKMRKVAADEITSAVTPALLGGALGAAGGHMFPTEPAKLLRESAGKMVESPAQRALLDKALRRNAWRVAKGTGLGLLGGAMLHGLLKDSPDVY